MMSKLKRRNCELESEDDADEEGEYEGKRVCEWIFQDKKVASLEYLGVHVKSNIRVAKNATYTSRKSIQRNILELKQCH